MTTTLTVRHEPDQHRFVGALGDEVVSLAEYAERDDVVVMHHTETDPAHGGNGYAKQVVVAALDQLRAEGKRNLSIGDCRVSMQIGCWAC